MRHALRRSNDAGGPHPSTLLYILSSPLSVLGIGMSGVGFVAAVVGAGSVRTPLCVGACLTWATLAFHKALHKPAMPTAHWLKVGNSFRFLLSPSDPF